MKTFEPGDLVNISFNKDAMKWERYKQKEPLEGLAVIVEVKSFAHLIYKVRMVKTGALLEVPGVSMQLVNSGKE